MSNDTVSLLNNLWWHDSVLYEIRFIRTDSADQVILILDLLEDWEEQTSRRVEIVFGRCYFVQSQINWGVKCLSDGEMILDADCKSSGVLFEKVISAWQNIDVDTSDLAEFKLTLASTNSNLQIVFGEVTLKYLGESSSHNAPPPLFPTKPEE